MIGRLGNVLYWAGCGVAALFAVIAIPSGPAKAQIASSDDAIGPLHRVGDEPSYLDLGAGAFNIQGYRNSGSAAEGRVEFRFGEKLFYLGPAIGVLGNTSGGVFCLCRRLRRSGFRSIRSDAPRGPGRLPSRWQRGPRRNLSVPRQRGSCVSVRG